MPEWQKLLVAAGGAAATAAVVYYLLKEDSDKSRALPVDEKSKAPAAAGKRKVEDVPYEEVLQILKEIAQSQDQMKGHMKRLIKELFKEPMDFDKVYTRVMQVIPADPLDKYQLSMGEFDRLLDTHQNDPKVREWIAKIMGSPSPDSVASDNAKAISVKQVMEVHQLMLQELDALAKKISEKPNLSQYDSKTVTIAAQAIVGYKVEDKFGITSEDIESAVLLHHTVLATDQEFANLNVNIQGTMGKLMQATSPGGMMG